MKKIPLNEFVKERTQVEAAEKLGMTQAAVAKALRKKREIYVVEDGGVFSAFEVRPFPSQKKAA